MLAYSLSPSFLDTYSLPMSYLGCKALCIVINFLVLWSFCLSSSLVRFKNDPEYITRGTAQVSIPLMWFLLRNLVSRTFPLLPSSSSSYYYYYYYLLIKVFYISVSWWPLTGVWVTPSLLKSPGLFSVF